MGDGAARAERGDLRGIIRVYKSLEFIMSGQTGRRAEKDGVLASVRLCSRD